jgi:hypothetical protein
MLRDTHGSTMVTMWAIGLLASGLVATICLTCVKGWVARTVATQAGHLSSTRQLPVCWHASVASRWPAACGR